MSATKILPSDMAEIIQEFSDSNQPFAFATIIRTAGATAAKPGAKALIGADGSIERGFLGGECTHGAVKRGALLAMDSGTPQLISVAPEEHLSTLGVNPGEESDGVLYARSSCPSQGSVEIFIEPCLPMPELVILGKSPVAGALAQIAPKFQWAIRRDLDESPDADRFRFIVITTQGRGDLQALRSALAARSDGVAFVGSARKYAKLSVHLRKADFSEERIASVSAPAGLDIGAVTPEEIALSILAEVTLVRRGPVKRSDSS
ncbi:MAG: XdhC family protein [Rhodobacteraceae bacterium]|nr:XdhC family protein [Paracoccaceae bacterium]